MSINCSDFARELIYYCVPFKNESLWSPTHSLTTTTTTIQITTVSPTK